MAKDLNAIIQNLRTDLSDIAETEWTATELERSVERAVSDLSRFIPRELIFDLTLTSDIIEDKVMIDLGNYIGEEDGMDGFIRVVKVEFPTNQVPQVFCSFDIFANILIITGFGESEGQDTLSNQEIRIYYDSPHVMPEDDEPGTIPVFLENTVILAASAYAMFQRALHYNHQASADFDTAKLRLASMAASHATISGVLDDVKKYLNNNSNADAAGILAKITTDIEGLRTAIVNAQDAANSELDGGALGDAGNHIGLGADALLKVTTYLETNASNENAKGLLTRITTDAASLRTAISDAVDALNTYLDAVADDLTAADNARANYMGDTANYVDGGTAPDIKKYLDDGDAHLNKLADGGEGQAVPLAYVQYSRAVRDALVSPHETDRDMLARNATTRTNAAMIYAQEAAQRLSNLRSYIEQATAWGSIARGFVEEASQRVAMASQIINRENTVVNRAVGYVNEAESRLSNLRSYIEQSVGYINIASTFVRDVESRLVDMNTYIQEAAHYESIATANILLADKFKEHAIERRNEAWSIWKDRKQYIGDFAGSSVRQMPSY